VSPRPDPLEERRDRAPSGVVYDRQQQFVLVTEVFVDRLRETPRRLRRSVERWCLWYPLSRTGLARRQMVRPLRAELPSIGFCHIAPPTVLESQIV